MTRKEQHCSDCSEVTHPGQVLQYFNLPERCGLVKVTVKKIVLFFVQFSAKYKYYVVNLKIT